MVGLEFYNETKPEKNLFVTEAQKIYVSLEQEKDASAAYYFISDLMDVSHFIDKRPDTMSVYDAAKEFALFKAGLLETCWSQNINGNNGLVNYA